MKKKFMLRSLAFLVFINGCLVRTQPYIPYKVTADIAPFIVNFEKNNKNEMVKQSLLRKEGLEIFVPNSINGDEELNRQVLRQTPYNMSTKGVAVDLDNLKLLHVFRSHLQRISENSKEAYVKFHQKVLDVNSPNLYHNIEELVDDFNSISLRDGVKVEANWDKILQFSGAESTKIINTYNYFFNHFGKENAKRWLFLLQVAPRFEGLVQGALGVTYNQYNYGFQYINLTYQGFDKYLINSNYETGFFASNNVTTTLIHELGHGLDNAVRLKPNQWNMNYLPTQDIVDYPYKNRFTGLKSWLQKYPDVNKNAVKFNYKFFTNVPEILRGRKAFILFIAQKLGYNPTEIKIDDKTLEDNDFSETNQETKNAFTLSRMFVDSIYGRSSWGEFFAEIFSEWLWTPTVEPRDKLSIRWKVLNEFFLEYLPTTYNELI